IIPATLWNPELVKRSQMLDPKEGEVVPLTVTDQGPVELTIDGKTVKARHYVLKGKFTQDVWYDQQGRLVQSSLVAPDNSLILYKSMLFLFVTTQARVGKIRPSFDPFDPGVESVQPARQAGILIFQNTETRLHIPHVLAQAVDRATQVAQVIENKVFNFGHRASLELGRKSRMLPYSGSYVAWKLPTG